LQSKLLTKIYPTNRDLATAFHLMVYGKNEYPNSSRDYVYAKELISSIGLSEETKRKISKASKGRLHTKEAREKMSKALKGKPAPNKGKMMSEEQKKQMQGRLKNRLEKTYVLNFNKEESVFNEKEKLDAMSGATDSWGNNFAAGEQYKNVKEKKCKTDIRGSGPDKFICSDVLMLNKFKQ
jgi:hypothetical protein